PAAIDRVRERDQIEPAGHRLSSLHGHLARDRPSVSHLDLLIRERTGSRQQAADTEDHQQRVAALPAPTLKLFHPYYLLPPNKNYTIARKRAGEPQACARL